MKDMCKLKNPPAFAREMAISSVNAKHCIRLFFRWKWLIKIVTKQPNAKYLCEI